MNIPHPEKRRIKIWAGELPSSKIASLAACHPFTQQLDIVFPSNPALLSTLEKLETSYAKGKAKLSDVLNNSDTFDPARNILVVTSNPQEEDVWCIDSRSHLTLSVTKETYQRLGLMGQKLPFKNHSERHVIDIPLRKNSQPPAIQTRQKTSLENWDKRREEQLGTEGGLWDVAYCVGVAHRFLLDYAALPHGVFQELRVLPVQCRISERKDVHVPIPGLSPRPEPVPLGSNRVSVDGDEGLVDWDDRVQNLFEWIGMACLGAQRLYANDRVNPYVALYEHPTPSRVDDITHLQWKGLLHPAFVGKVLDTVMYVALSSQFESSISFPFVGITSHALTTSPISYIPYTTTTTLSGTFQIPGRVPAHLPRVGGEDSWSLILERDESQGPGMRWCLGESLGQWDARWG
ncbi:hypothetical protein M413DRAFT_67558 [Hebeloma cylindrosporum]|uniref:Uncharacterized protein n=1 Tax=Hebeloma cylindrosporum TaxID=76867 RepID=A0A0C3C6F9_HEBCY|nr:hypothetical protein M413DRAFT_67558 [Hebeloma cylindrosporum h7]